MADDSKLKKIWDSIQPSNLGRNRSRTVGDAVSSRTAKDDHPSSKSSNDPSHNSASESSSHYNGGTTNSSSGGSSKEILSSKSNTTSPNARSKHLQRRPSTLFNTQPTHGPDEEVDENDFIRARALYDYNSREQDEISFKAGQTVFIFHKHESGWWTGEAQGKYGLFPSSYVFEDIDEKASRKLLSDSNHQIERPPSTVQKTPSNEKGTLLRASNTTPSKDSNRQRANSSAEDLAMLDLSLQNMLSHKSSLEHGTIQPPRGRSPSISKSKEKMPNSKPSTPAPGIAARTITPAPNIQHQITNPQNPTPPPPPIITTSSSADPGASVLITTIQNMKEQMTAMRIVFEQYMNNSEARILKLEKKVSKEHSKRKKLSKQLQELQDETNKKLSSLESKQIIQQQQTQSLISDAPSISRTLSSSPALSESSYSSKTSSQKPNNNNNNINNNNGSNIPFVSEQQLQQQMLQKQQSDRQFQLYQYSEPPSPGPHNKNAAPKGLTNSRRSTSSPNIGIVQKSNSDANYLILDRETSKIVNPQKISHHQPIISQNPPLPTLPSSSASSQNNNSQNNNNSQQHQSPVVKPKPVKLSGRFYSDDEEEQAINQLTSSEHRAVSRNNSGGSLPPSANQFIQSNDTTVRSISRHNSGGSLPPNPNDIVNVPTTTTTTTTTTRSFSRHNSGGSLPAVNFVPTVEPVKTLSRHNSGNTLPPFSEVVASINNSSSISNQNQTNNSSTPKKLDLSPKIENANNTNSSENVNRGTRSPSLLKTSFRGDLGGLSSGGDRDRSHSLDLLRTSFKSENLDRPQMVDLLNTSRSSSSSFTVVTPKLARSESQDMRDLDAEERKLAEEERLIEEQEQQVLKRRSIPPPGSIAEGEMRKQEMDEFVNSLEQSDKGAGSPSGQQQINSQFLPKHMTRLERSNSQPLQQFRRNNEPMYEGEKPFPFLTRSERSSSFENSPRRRRKTVKESLFDFPPNSSSSSSPVVNQTQQTS